MTEIDRRIESLGYEVRVIDLPCGYIVYENKKQDQEIVIEWDDEDDYCKIFSQTISRVKDWFGNTIQEPNALTIREAEIFIAKINEMRNES